MGQAEKKSVSNAGNLYLIFLGLLLFAMGAGFMFIMWLSFQRANHTRTWKEVPCRILKSEIKTEERIAGKLEYQWNGEYTYELEGEDYVSTRFELRGNKWSSQKDRIEAVVRKYPAGKSAVCYVDPKDITFSILKHDSKAAGYNIWFPGLFALGGVGMIFGAVKKWNSG